MARNLEIDGRKLKDIQVIHAVDSDTKEYVPYIDTHDATATSEDIIEGKTAYVDGKEVVGTHPDIRSPYAGFAALVDGSITEVTAEMLEGATKIRSYAFYYYDVLTSITIPSSVTIIDTYAFAYCKSLISVTILNGVTSIKPSTFRSCSSLTTITIPNSVTSIGMDAFSECSSLTSVAIPDSVTNISEYLFTGCSSLTSITIPNSVKSIGHSSFAGCSSLTSIAIPGGVTAIAFSTFSKCSSLTSITIPNSVKSIGNNSFSDCSTNTELGGTYTILATTPPTIQSNTFRSAKISKIIVPIGTADTYKAATNWSALADYIQEAEA